MACTVRWIQNLVVEHREVKSQAKSVSLREKDEREGWEGERERGRGRELEKERKKEREREGWERDVKESRNNYDHAKVEKEKLGQSKR